MSGANDRGDVGCSAPRLPELLLGWGLPAHEQGAVFGDLNEEYELYVLPQRGKLGADLWYWRQALRSFVPNLHRRRAAAPGGRGTPAPDLPPGRSQPSRRFNMDRLKLDIRMGLRTLRSRP